MKCTADPLLVIKQSFVFSVESLLIFPQIYLLWLHLYILLCKNACFRAVCGYIVAYNTSFCQTIVVDFIHGELSDLFDFSFLHS